jgi:hypothetical protein
MIGNYYFSPGISIYQQYPGTDSLWIAQVEFEDSGHAQLGSTKGSLSTKYPTNLLDSVKTVYDDVLKLGILIKWIPGEKLRLYVCRLEVETPEVWQEIEAVALKLGFEAVRCLPTASKINKE